MFQIGKQKVFLALFVFIGLVLAIFPKITFAEVEGQTNLFFVEKDYDGQQRDQVLATLVKISQNGYFYVDSFWYQNLTEQERGLVNQNLADLTTVFDQEIYPKLTGFWGSEWKPGIDNDFRITIFFEQMIDGAAGYFNDGNEYIKQQSRQSNEREMVYLSAEYLKSTLIKAYLAHEFTHLISFNQKEKTRGINEEVWLNEARAEYSVFYLGYDTPLRHTNLQQRISQFAVDPSNSITDWSSTQADYGVIEVFTLYLAEKYGPDVLVRSLQSSKAGVDSLNEALQTSGQAKDLFQIFSDWAVAILLNDCSVSDAYCYKTQNLQSLRIAPILVVLPSVGQTNMLLNYSLSPWSGRWYRFIGSEGTLKLTFNFDNTGIFNLPYVLCEKQNGCKVFSLNVVSGQKQELVIENFSQKYLNITLLPVVKPRYLNMQNNSFSFSVTAQTNNGSLTITDNTIEQLQAQIELLRAQIEKVKAQLAALGKSVSQTISCSQFLANLYIGLKSNEVSCLQEFLKNQGSDIYPQGVVSGYFGALTKAAVIKFQQKYTISPTGYVGVLTRAKINQLLLKN